MNLTNFIYDEGYSNPYFITLGNMVNHKSSLYSGFRLSRLINRGHTTTGLTREDVHIGVNIGIYISRN